MILALFNFFFFFFHLPGLDFTGFTNVVYMGET